VFLDPRLKQKIPELRRKYKEIYLIDLSGQPDELKISPNVLIRPLTRQEFLFLQSDIELGCDPTEELLRSCIIWPEIDWSNEEKNSLFDLPCMCFDQLSKCIIDISGFSSNEDIAEAFSLARMNVNSLDSVLQAVVMGHFSGITPQEFDSMSLTEVAKLFAIAETFLQQPIDLRLFLDTEYAEKQMRVAKRSEERNIRRQLPNTLNSLSVPSGWDSVESTE